MTQLAVLALPGSLSFWGQYVDGCRVWEDLQPRSSSNAIDKWLDVELSEFVSFVPFSFAERDVMSCVAYVGHSRIDLDVALTSALHALYAGLAQAL